ncbi:hypothetical protein [Roseimaritima sediminicola]|uniref:hypothetical protein n=1 Tax=Roseimaritima sediminicola TaxID=2662066 RepID=UPI00129835DB|nr:hypothetical protein [Roseimaritima sediminicola]
MLRPFAHTLPLALALLASSTGCTLVQSPGKRALSDATGSPLAGNASLEQLQAGGSTEVFQRIKQAKKQNSIVLQIEGDAQPIRVLPLPPEGKTVYVSDLLDQTEVGSLFGGMQVRVFRDSKTQMDGVRMDVQMEGKEVRPESDYALRPGDRIQIRKHETTLLQRLFGDMVPKNTVRAIGG